MYRPILELDTQTLACLLLFTLAKVDVAMLVGYLMLLYKLM